jgi:hypothetical protein
MIAFPGAVNEAASNTGRVSAARLVDELLLAPKELGRAMTVTPELERGQ